MDKSELYKYIYETCSEEEREEITRLDIPIPVLKGKVEISKEDKEEAQRFIESIAK